MKPNGAARWQSITFDILVQPKDQVFKNQEILHDLPLFQRTFLVRQVESGVESLAQQSLRLRHSVVVLSPVPVDFLMGYLLNWLFIFEGLGYFRNNNFI